MWNETINHMISEYSKQTRKEYKTRHDWVGNVIHGELCKKVNKWYMHNPESVLENETRELLWDFEIQTDPLNSSRQQELIIINNKKENLQNCGLCCPSGPQNKIERMRKDG